MLSYLAIYVLTFWRMKSSAACSPSQEQIFSRPSSLFDRRGAIRLDMTCPVFLSKPGDSTAVVSKTENLSTKGFYCISDRPFSPHETLNCELEIPSAAPGHLPQVNLVLRAVVEVVRVVAKGMDPGYGLACQIKSYTIGPKL
jgi:hypothetical protein